MKLSRYNSYLEEPDGSMLLYNSRTGGLLRLNEGIKEQIRNVRDVPADLRDFLHAEKFLLDDDVDELELIRRGHEAARSDNATFSATIVLTTACNFRCLYCYQDHLPQHLSPLGVKKITAYLLRKLDEVSHLHLNWFGGEPLLRIDTMKSISHRLQEEAQRRGRTISQFITTNGYLLTPEVADELREMGIENVQITIDGSIESHDRTRIHPSGASTYFRLLDACKEVVNRDMELIVRINVNRWDASHIEGLLKDLKEKGVTPANAVIHAVRTVDHSGGTAETAPIFFSTEEFAAEWVKILEVVIAAGFSIPDLYPRSYNCSFDMQQTVMLGTDGDIYHCSSSDGKLAEVAENGEERNWTPLYETVKKRRPVDDPRCRECYSLPLCMGGCSYLAELGENKCNPETYIIPELVRLVIRSDRRSHRPTQPPL